MEIDRQSEAHRPQSLRGIWEWEASCKAFLWRCDTSLSGMWKRVWMFFVYVVWHLFFLDVCIYIYLSFAIL